jgi:hypothetical protein
MKNIIVFAVAGMVVLGLLMAGCVQKKAEESVKSGQTTTAPAPAPAKKSPVGC